MDFIILLLINTCMGVIFYLIISLKLEKSASEFREKKLHEEMDKIIKEFNRTAERNISLLENRITVLRKLLQQNGVAGGVDIIIDDDKDMNQEKEVKGQQSEKLQEIQENHMSRKMGSVDIPPTADAAIRKKETLFSFLSQTLTHVLYPLGKKKEESKCQGELHNYSEELPAGNERLFPQITHEDNVNSSIIERNYEDVSGFSEPLEVIDYKKDTMAEEDIVQLISENNDTYTVISLLHNKGLPADDISRYVGLPVGEIRLVLNLNDSKF